VSEKKEEQKKREKEELHRIPSKEIELLKERVRSSEVKEVQETVIRSSEVAEEKAQAKTQAKTEKKTEKEESGKT